MASVHDDQLYAVEITLDNGEAPGKHILAMRSSPNRSLASKHLKQVVDAKNDSDPDAHMKVVSMTACTQEELEAMVSKLREDPEHTPADAVYPDARERGRLIAPKGATSDKQSSLDAIAESDALAPSKPAKKSSTV